MSDPSHEDVRRLVQDLRDTMWSYEICVGLAAPQIGVGLRVLVANASRADREDDIVMINPRILKEVGKKDVKRESCMSLWGAAGEVQRRVNIVVEYTDADGKRTSRPFSGFEARVIQHEVAHLDGVLYDTQLKPGTELAKTDIFANTSPEAPASQ